jgi:hypothetical protein
MILFFDDSDSWALPARKKRNVKLISSTVLDHMNPPHYRNTRDGFRTRRENAGPAIRRIW